ncbi:MAG: peptide deformylase [Pelolinea sp.]|nr:peptide deformylase [Pelolinea sp.]
MALRDVIKLPNPVLRRKAHKVTDFGSDFQACVEDMIETMRNEPGVGLAAPQVNISQRLIVVEYPEDDEIEDALPKLFIVANPEFNLMSKDLVKGTEGCLSVPNLLGQVERSNEVIITGLDRRGKKQTIHARGWLARIFQHEVDHLNGVLFVDRALELYQPEEVQANERV